MRWKSKNQSFSCISRVLNSCIFLPKVGLFDTFFARQVTKWAFKYENKHYLRHRNASLKAWSAVKKTARAFHGINLRMPPLLSPFCMLETTYGRLSIAFSAMFLSCRNLSHGLRVCFQRTDLDARLSEGKREDLADLTCGNKPVEESYPRCVY